jgi:hypothetical protein
MQVASSYEIWLRWLRAHLFEIFARSDALKYRLLTPEPNSIACMWLPKDAATSALCSWGRPRPTSHRPGPNAVELDKASQHEQWGGDPWLAELRQVATRYSLYAHLPQQQSRTAKASLSPLTFGGFPC